MAVRNHSHFKCMWLAVKIKDNLVNIFYICHLVSLVVEPAEGEKLVKKPPLKCHICGKKSKRKAILMVHLAREHGIGEEPFKCFICGLGAAFEKTMRVHLESHLPYKRYQCTNCGVRFSNKRTLATHALHEKCFSSSFRRPSES